MKRWLMFLPLCLVPLLALAEPKVLVESRLVPEGKALVGGTLQLQVDVLTNTWFTAAPQFQTLTLTGAQVSQPGGEAGHLNQQREDGMWFGLRFHYQITPQQAQAFHIPSLNIQLSLGQSSGPISVATTPLDFVASQPEGLNAGQLVLVAQGLNITQYIEPSHTPLRMGDSIVRRLVLEVEGAQAMSIPAPSFVDVEGLQRYIKTPQVESLSNGRGSVSGGRRVDEASYIINRPGEYQLPTIKVQWWDSTTGRLRTSSVLGQTFIANASPTYQAPFSIDEDLRALGWHARVQISQHWLLLALLMIGGGFATYWGLPGGRRGLAVWRAWRRRRQQAYQHSALFAWRQLKRQLRARPARVDALYLWARRSLQVKTLNSMAGKVAQPSAQKLLVFLQACYGPSAQAGTAVNALQQALPQLKASAWHHHAQSMAQYSLVPLNPRQSVTGSILKENQ